MAPGACPQSASMMTIPPSLSRARRLCCVVHIHHGLAIFLSMPLSFSYQFFNHRCQAAPSTKPRLGSTLAQFELKLLSCGACSTSHVPILVSSHRGFPPQALFCRENLIHITWPCRPPTQLLRCRSITSILLIRSNSYPLSMPGCRKGINSSSTVARSASRRALVSAGSEPRLGKRLP